MPGRRRRREIELERVLGTPGALRHRLRKRRLLDLLRARPHRGLRTRADPTRLRHRGRDLRRDGGDVRRGNGAVPGGRGLGELRAACVRRARQLHRGLGADARLHRHRRSLGVLRPSLPVDLLGAAAHESVGHRRRRDRDRRPCLAQHRRDSGGREALDHAGRGRLRDPGPPRDHRFRARLQRGRADEQRSLGSCSDMGEPGGRDPGRDARIHGGGDRLEPRGGGPRPGSDRAECLQGRRGRRLRDLLHSPVRRALRSSGREDRRRADRRGSRSHPRRGAMRTTRFSGSSRTSGSTRAGCSTRWRSTSACSRRRSSSSRRTPA